MTRLEQINVLCEEIDDACAFVGEAQAEAVYFNPSIAECIWPAKVYIRDLEKAVMLADESLGYWLIIMPVPVIDSSELIF